MGGDFAPANIVTGALDALRVSGNRFELIFVGTEHLVLAELRKHGLNGPGGNISIVPSQSVIDMHDPATAAVRQKKDSSIAVGIALQTVGKADAFVSAGHTGAVMSASTLILGRIEGVGRPTIGAFFPSSKGVCLVVDAGANVDCKSQHLYQFGIMGSIYAREMFGFPNPTVGLLNVGEEETKGSEIVREAHALLKASGLNFIGNVEGRDVLAGKANVVVCDGFVGNVLLKFGESVPAFLKHAIREQIEKSLLAKIVGGLFRSTLRGAMKGMDYEESGGVPVLGVNGVSIIGHGKSSPKAIRNMVLKAEEMIQKNINGSIRQSLAGSAAETTHTIAQ